MSILSVSPTQQATLSGSGGVADSVRPTNDSDKRLEVWCRRACSVRPEHPPLRAAGGRGTAGRNRPAV